MRQISAISVGLAISGLIVLALGARLPWDESDTALLGPLAAYDADLGEALYSTYCMACHGAQGVGERPSDIYATNGYGYVAPPMDDTGHAWHHTDDQLIEIIMEGSPRNPRMISWRSVMTETDARNIVAYIKSLWSPFIVENCQGPAHMNPGC